MMNIRILSGVLLLFLGFCAPVFAQITDNFNDGDFTQNPSWQGDVGSFIVNSKGELQLNAPAAGQSQLLVQGNIPDSVSWDFNIRMEFAASTSNLLRVFLLLDGPDPNTANGYHLEIGENGNVDALKLYRQKGSTRTLLASGVVGLAGKDTIQLRIRLIRSLSGIWTAEAARDCPSFEPQFSVQDSTYKPGADRYFGFQCRYTETRKDKFYFDDIRIGAPELDKTAPKAIAVVAEDSLRVRIDFDEKLDSNSAKILANYLISGGIGQPVKISRNSCGTSVFLQLSKSLATGNYTLNIQNLKDEAGNILTTQSLDFQYLKIETPVEYDLIINELMVDPTPRRGLPDAEWIEVLNRSQKHFQMSALRIGDGAGTGVVIPAYIIKPGEYIVLTNTTKVDSLRAVTNATVLGVSISTIELKNDGDIVVLKTANNIPIDLVEYSLEWYADDAKRDGGWSLERINPNTPCIGRANWQACPNFPAPGGTPGAINRSYDIKPDTQAPRMISAFPLSATQIEVRFTEGLDRSAWETPSAWRMQPALNISNIQASTDRSLMLLTLNQAMQLRTRYALTVGAAVRDCAGNLVPATDTAFVGLAEKPEKQDIVINEVLFNPPTGAARYVEFYNRSNKVFDWSEFILSDPEISQSIEEITVKRLFFPGEYHVFTSTPVITRERYQDVLAVNFIRQDLPSMYDDEGSIVISWLKNGVLTQIDSFYYDKSMHNALLSESDKDGVALERIRTESATNDRNNWTSASPIPHGAPGSPTQPNTQRIRNQPDADDNLIQLSAERLSPDDDGYEDFLDIQYTLPSEGYAASLSIFDANGQLVKNLVRQELIGTEGALRWDGDLDDGARARPGIYVLFLEVFNPSGEVKRVKKAVAVVQRF
jgi:Lamin Tail Domain/Bacterial Ig-like domain